MRRLFLLLALLGCAGTTYQTESGNPEVLLPNTTVAAAKQLLVARSAARGMTVVRSDDVSVMTQKAFHDYWHEKGSRIEHFTLVAVGSNVRVIGTVATTDGLGEPEEDKTTKEEGRELSTFLQSLKTP